MRFAWLAVLATLTLSIVAAPRDITSQSMPNMPRIGYLCALTCGTVRNLPGRSPLPLELFAQALEGLGYVDGRNIKIEYFPPEQAEPEQRGRLAGELVRRQVDVIFVAGESETVLAARNATSTILNRAGFSGGSIP